MTGLPPRLELIDIHKRYGSVHALRGAGFTLHPGEIHALLGENGAGKTTLMHVAYGLATPDSGEVRIDGVPARVASPRAARALGIGMVHQHSTAIAALTVAENVALAAGWSVAPGPLRARVRALSERVGLLLDPDDRVRGLSVGMVQRLEIVKALAAGARVLLLDEPTAVLAPAEVEELFRVVRRFTDGGGAAVLITHKLDEARMGADRVTVLRAGAVVLSGRVSEFDVAALAVAMVGEERRASATPTRARTSGGVRVRLRNLDVERESGSGLAVRTASLEVRAGEILGIVAVEGNGQRELLRAVAGRIPPRGGTVEVEGPVAFIPEDRTTEALLPALSLVENVVLGSGAGDPWISGARIDWRQAWSRTAELLEEFRVVAPDPGVAAGSLSGGNQQRVVLARELARRPVVIVAENPTRGLDLRATAEIHGRLRAAAAGGAAVLVHAADLDEVLELAHRVVVMSRGAMTEPPIGASRAVLGALMLGGS